ncbi:MAG: ATP-dependent Clp protease adaptor ClpS [Phycisphaerae bacterium]|nr:ATP-dependent Clp protease adaptor ClpS [Phycisphaerae bacterium]
MSADGQKNAHAKPRTVDSTAVLPDTARPRLLPMFRVILHNDDVNDIEHVVRSIVMLTPLNGRDAIKKTLEAHTTGCSLLLVTHKERAELYVEQFESRGLTVTIESDD